MQKLLELVGKVASELHVANGMAISKKMLSMESVESFSHVKRELFPIGIQSIVDQLEVEMKKQGGLRPRELAYMLYGAFAGVQSLRREEVEIVWTGPSTSIVPVRHTEQVLCEIVDLATEYIVVVSYVLYNVNNFYKSIKRAISRGVKVVFLLESSVDHGGKVTIDSISDVKKTLPDSTVYCWDKRDSTHSSVHAKCVVSDNKCAFITSANLTSAAMEHNMELGILVRGGALPQNLNDHFSQLINLGIVTEV